MWEDHRKMPGPLSHKGDARPQSLMDFLEVVGLGPGDSELRAIQGHFHALVRARSGPYLAKSRVVLPTLDQLRLSREVPGWLGIPGMFGGFRYTLVGMSGGLALRVESRFGIWPDSGHCVEIRSTGQGWAESPLDGLLDDELAAS